ncbi:MULTISPECIES: hypothetical protein [unclassified Streptosporangium]|uniref:hypothetical protein n=1 Tax=unclassified Streptosporangium TaxID=2632669 RepID=UPI002E28682A|nr:MULTISPECIES: hypothetical protein [unclassified Streptosporangium]
MVLSLFVGMLLGGVGALLAYGPDLLYALYNPYAYLLLVVVMGRTAAGFGWAVLSSVLAAFGPILSLLVATIFESNAWRMSLGDDGASMNLMIANLVAIGVLSYLAKRYDRWGDVAAGGAAGLALFDGIDKAMPGGPEHVSGFWPWGVTVVAAITLGMLVSLGRGCDRACSALIALVLGASYFVFLTGL